MNQKLGPNKNLGYFIHQQQAHLQKFICILEKILSIDLIIEIDVYPNTTSSTIENFLFTCTILQGTIVVALFLGGSKEEIDRTHDNYLDKISSLS